MASEDTLNMMIEDKVTSLKEELEELIEEVKNEVDDRGSELVSNRELQSQSFNKLDKSMDKLRKELKQFGKTIHYLVNSYCPTNHIFIYNAKVA